MKLFLARIAEGLLYVLVMGGVLLFFYVMIDILFSEMWYLAAGILGTIALASFIAWGINYSYKHDTRRN